VNPRRDEPARAVGGEQGGAGERPIEPPVAGDSAAGDSAAGDSAAGDSAAGDSAAGDSAAGDSAAGDSTAHEIPIEDHLDLHVFRPRDVPDVVRDYLDAAAERGFDEVRLIHGRGIGVQRERVREVLAAHPRVGSFHDAPPERGGWGATVVRLRN
jgi:hypothetical protein